MCKIRGYIWIRNEQFIRYWEGSECCDLVGYLFRTHRAGVMVKDTHRR